MQKRGIVDKGFFLTVVLILGVVLVVSFMNPGGTAGKYHESLDVEAPIPVDCPPTVNCGKEVIEGKGNGFTEGIAISRALNSCKEKQQDTATVDKCIADATLACLKAGCVPKPSLNNKITDCVIKICSHKIYNQETEGTGNPSYTICTYNYDEQGKKIEPGTCITKDGMFDPSTTWECTAQDGTYSGKVECAPPPKKTD